MGAKGRGAEGRGPNIRAKGRGTQTPILLTKTLCKENVKFLKHSYRVKRQVGTML